MSSTFLALVCSFLTAESDLALAPDVQLHYQGTVAQVRRDRAEPVAEKTFDLTWLPTRVDTDGVGYVWLVDERGAGAFGWSDRCGRWAQNAEGATTGPA